MGNLQDFDFNVQKLLKSEKAKKIIKHIKDSKCHCTFECPKHMDALYNKKLYPELLKNLAKHYIFSYNAVETGNANSGIYIYFYYV